MFLLPCSGVNVPEGYKNDDGTPWKASFSYADKDNWHNQFPEFCALNSQSPINLDRFDSGFRPFGNVVFGNYDTKPSSWIGKNTGYTAQFNPSSTSGFRTPFIMGGALGLLNKFYLEQFHFHWGSDDTQGSEHQLDSVRYPMEVHFVHRSARYGSLGDAVGHAGGLAVVGVMFQQSANDNPMLAPVIEALENVVASSTMHTLTTDMQFDNLLPSDRDHYYAYDGGLTTPPCNEVVNWIVYTTPVTASEAQLNKFRALTDASGNAVEDNYRNVQPVNNRKVYRNFA